MSTKMISVFDGADEEIREAWEECILFSINCPASEIPQIVKDYCGEWEFHHLKKAERKQLEDLLRLTWEAYRAGY